MKITEQTITLDSLRFYAYHGAEPQEAIVGAWYTVDITIKTDATFAVQSDDLNGTINYAKVTDAVKQQMQIRSALLEHVAGRINRIFRNQFTNCKSLQGKPTGLRPVRSIRLHSHS